MFFLLGVGFGLVFVFWFRCSEGFHGVLEEVFKGCFFLRADCWCLVGFWLVLSCFWVWQ